MRSHKLVVKSRVGQKRKCRVLSLFVILSAILLSWTAANPVFSQNIRFSVASYNVENLFDLKADGTEYPEYLPNGPAGWTRAVQSVKVAHTARVIKELDADIVCLQEVESIGMLTFFLI